MYCSFCNKIIRNFYEFFIELLRLDLIAKFQCHCLELFRKYIAVFILTQFLAILDN